MLASGCDLLDTSKPTTPQGDTGNAPMHVRGYAESYGSGTLGDRFDAIRTLSDGGYIVVGTGGAFVANETATADPPNKIWAIRTNADGSVAWQFRYVRRNSQDGQLISAEAKDVELTGSGEFLIAGRVGGDALVIKLNGDGSVAWQWSRHEDGAQNEAVALEVTADGRILVAGGTDRGIINQRVSRDAWVAVLDSIGTIAPDSTRQVFAGGWPSALALTQDGGFIVTGEEVNANPAHLNWVARYRRESNTDFQPVWLKTYGRGTLNAIVRSGDTFVLAGASLHGPQVFELAADGSVITAYELRTPDGEPTPDELVRKINAIYVTDDGYLLAGVFGSGNYAGFAWVARLTRGPGFAQRTVQWQRNFVGPAWLDSRFPSTAAESIDRGVNGGYRVAGRMASLTEFSGGATDSNYGWVLDLDRNGSIDVNPVSGVYMAPTSLTPVEVSNDQIIIDRGTVSVSVPDQARPEPLVVAEPTNAVIETMSAPSGALNSPAVGSNRPGHTFYWTGAAEASGFLMFRSRDGVTYYRGSNWFSSGIDYGGGYIEDHASFFKVVAFNAAGYSDYSSVVELESDEPTGPGEITLNVMVIGGDGFVVSTPFGIDCPDDCSEPYDRSSAGTAVLLTAGESMSSAFSSWQGCDSVDGARCTLVMTNADRTVTASFRARTPTTPN